MSKNESSTDPDLNRQLQLLVGPKPDFRVMLDDGIPHSSLILLDQYKHYQNMAKWSLFCSLVTGLVLIVVVLALAHVTSRPPITLGYTVDRDNRIQVLQDVGIPTMTDAQVLSWSARKAIDIHKLAFTDWQDHIYSLEVDFTPSAHDNYIESLRSSKTLQKIVESNLVSWAEPLKAPKIVKSGAIGGIFTWTIQLEMTLYFGGGAFTTTGTDVVATMVVERTSRANNLSGVVISQYLVKEKL